jgi:hypothetical protein
VLPVHGYEQDNVLSTSVRCPCFSNRVFNIIPLTMPKFDKFPLSC